jgi:putative sterol carrier protein
MRTDLVTFMAIGAGQLDPIEALLTGHAEVEGEAEAAMRCLAIFGFGRTAGAPSPQG